MTQNITKVLTIVEIFLFKPNLDFSVFAYAGFISMSTLLLRDNPPLTKYILSTCKICKSSNNKLCLEQLYLLHFYEFI